MPPTNGRDDNSQISNEDSEDLCKEVRCIETNETEENECLESSALGSNSLQDSNVASSMQGDNNPNRSVNSRQHDASSITLELYTELIKLKSNWQEQEL
jgi:centromeric protein E